MEVLTISSLHNVYFNICILWRVQDGSGDIISGAIKNVQMQVAPHSCPVYVYYDIETSEEEYLECFNLERLLFIIYSILLSL